MAAKPKARVFLVGCPRSGTTLLQSMLSAHPDILSFPESHFFPYLVPRLPPFRTMGFAAPRVRRRLRSFLDELGEGSMATAVPRFSPFMRRYCDGFIEALDTLAQRAGKSIWLEKTPRHLHFIAHIERLVPGARFIHLIRNGAHVVASLYQVTHEHPEAWGGARGIKRCVRRWIGDVRISLAYREHMAHKLVSYHRLVDQPRTVISEVCRFLDLGFHEATLERRADAPIPIIAPSEHWKAGVAETLRDTGAEKFRRVFDAEQRAYITARISAVTLDGFELGDLEAVD